MPITRALQARPGFKFGCDPELFVFDDKNRPVPADMIPGTKAEPHPVKFGAVQRDGFAAEFNIEPAETFTDFNRNITSVLSQLEKMLPPGYSLQAVPAVTFAEDVFASAADDVKELGCTPDFDAWTGGVNPPPKDPDNPFLRTASGHLHIGWTEDQDIADLQHKMNCCDLVKQLDWYLGAWSLSLDKDPTRRRLYGKAGACRFKDYGVEYRVLSNFWVTSRERRLAVWNRMQHAIEMMAKHYIPDRVGSKFNDAVVSSINTSSVSPLIAGNFHYPLSTLDTGYINF